LGALGANLVVLLSRQTGNQNTLKQKISKFLVLISRGIKFSKNNRDLRKGAASAPPDNQAVLAIIARDIVLLPDCGPQREMNTSCYWKRDCCHGKTQYYIGGDKRTGDSSIHTTAAAIVSTTADFLRGHGGRYLSKDTAWAAACHTACRRFAAVAQAGLPRACACCHSSLPGHHAGCLSTSIC
jgi:hypothetical protein